MKKFCLYALGLLLATGLTGGCCPKVPAGKTPVPKPINLLLPKKIRIQPLSGIKKLETGTNVRGLDVRIEAIDFFGDSTKAFGILRFELYAHHNGNIDPKGKRLDTWTVSILNPNDNRKHWDITQVYQFKLQMDQPIPANQPYVLEVIFASPFTERLIAERVYEGK